MTDRDRLERVIVAGHRHDHTTVLAHVGDTDDGVRAAVLGALERCGRLDDDVLVAAFDDPAVTVRRRAAELAARRPRCSLAPLLTDDDATVVEVAIWACGEQGAVDDAVLDRVIELATSADTALVREAAAAALGAIGDERGLPAVLAACTDKPAVRRRAVLALAPFDAPEVETAIDRALTDRDWQVRQAAEDLRRAVGQLDLPTALGDD